MSEYNLCGVLVHAQQNNRLDVQQHLQQQQGTEVHAVTEEGRLVVTMEDKSRKQLADRIMKLNQIEGVLSASMIFQYSDDELSEQETPITNLSEERMSA